MTASVPLRPVRNSKVENRKWKIKTRNSKNSYLHTFPGGSSPSAKELSQDAGAFFGQHAGNNLNPMIHFRVVEDREG